MPRFKISLNNTWMDTLGVFNNALDALEGDALDKVTFRVADTTSRDVKEVALDMLSGHHTGSWASHGFPFSRARPRPSASGDAVWRIHSKSGNYRLKKALHVVSKGVNQYRKDVTVYFDPIDSVAVLTPGGLPPDIWNGKKTSGMIDRRWWPRLAQQTRAIILKNGAKEG